jgi:hypothetical protein
MPLIYSAQLIFRWGQHSVVSLCPQKLTIELSRGLHTNIANCTYTMKYSLFLLAAIMLVTMCGAEIGWNVQGVVTTEEPCSAADEAVLYGECVQDVAAAMGVDLDRRLELRGNRELQQSNVCSRCCSRCRDCECYPRGTYCFTKCSQNRRLPVADEQAHTAWFLVATGQLQQAVTKCIDRKIEEGFTCLGNSEDLTIKIFLSK